MAPKANPKATLLLSHHQYFTAFKDHAYTKPAKQLVEFFQGQDVVWIWGHEHRLDRRGFPHLPFKNTGGVLQPPPQNLG
jgi:hypothetical protein